MTNKKLKEEMLQKIKDWNEDDETTLFINWNEIGWVYEIIKNWTGIPFPWYVFSLDDDEPLIDFTFYKNRNIINISINFKTKKAHVSTSRKCFSVIDDFDFTDRENQKMFYKQIKKFLYGEKKG